MHETFELPGDNRSEENVDDRGRAVFVESTDLKARSNASCELYVFITAKCAKIFPRAKMLPPCHPIAFISRGTTWKMKIKFNIYTATILVGVLYTSDGNHADN